MENFMRVEFAALAENEAFARSVVAAFITPADPTVEELTEVKTAVSEAVSNCIIHGYRNCEGQERVIMECTLDAKGRLTVEITDFGVGIEDVRRAMEPLFTTGDEEERSGMGFTVMESFMDRLKVRSEKGKGTTVFMVKQLDVISGI